MKKAYAVYSGSYLEEFMSYADAKESFDGKGQAQIRSIPEKRWLTGGVYEFSKDFTIVAEKDLETYYSDDFEVGREYMTINVSDRDSGYNRHAIQAHFPDLSDEAFEAYFTEAYDEHVARFWADASIASNLCWKSDCVQVQAAGRSNKHLIVQGVPLQADAKWKKFEKLIQALYERYTGTNEYVHTIKKLIDEE